MKMNKKGFTLIELLAVIVILAVIALIAVPRIIELLNNARKSAAEDSAYGMLEAAESEMTTYMLNHQGDFPAEGLTFAYDDTSKNLKDSKTSTELKFKGTKPTAGTITVTASEGAKISVALVINGFSCTQKDDIVSCVAGS